MKDSAFLIGRLIGRRLALGALTLAIVATFIFLAIELLPGDFAELALGREATEEAIQQLRVNLRLDRPLGERYVAWLVDIMRGDLGHSLSNGRDIAEIIGTRFYNTVFLALLAAVISIPLSITLGILAAAYERSIFDRLVNVTALSAMSVPDFFVAYILIIAFTSYLPIFPSISTIDPSTTFWEQVYRCILPAVTLSLVSIAHLMRMTRAAILEVLSSPYVEMARLKGMTLRRIVLWHALPNSIAPIVTVVMFTMAWLVVGVIIVEVVFAYPGLGQVLVDAVSKRDVPVVQACTLIFASAYIILNLTADVLAILSNPRLLHSR